MYIIKIDYVVVGFLNLYTMSFSYINPIQHAIQSGEVVRLLEPWPYNYYTCVREIIHDTKSDWYCAKGRYEFVYKAPSVCCSISAPSDVEIEQQTLRFCKFGINKELLIKRILDTDKVIFI
jgi:hypothetical protein